MMACYAQFIQLYLPLTVGTLYQYICCCIVRADHSKTLSDNLDKVPFVLLDKKGGKSILVTEPTSAGCFHDALHTTHDHFEPKVRSFGGNHLLPQYMFYSRSTCFAAIRHVLLPWRMFCCHNTCCEMLDGFVIFTPYDCENSKIWVVICLHGESGWGPLLCKQTTSRVLVVVQFHGCGSVQRFDLWLQYQ